MNMNRAGLSDKDRNQLQVLNALIGSREIYVSYTHLDVYKRQQGSYARAWRTGGRR